MNTIFSKLPQHIWANIYEYDPSYKINYKNCLKELAWKSFAKSLYDNHIVLYGRTRNLTLNEAHKILINDFQDIYPILDKVGFEPDSFDIRISNWYDKYTQNETNCEMLLSIQLKIKNLNPKLKMWAKEYKERELESYRIQNELDHESDTEDDITIDSEGNSYPLLPNRYHIYDNIYEYIACTIIKTENLTMETTTNMEFLQICIYHSI